MRQVNDNLLIVKFSKLDVAQWITTGVGNCSEPAVSSWLCRYAAEQLASVAMIPGSRCKSDRDRSQAPSLLRNALRTNSAETGIQSIALLAGVSRSMLNLLVAELGKQERSAASRRFISTLIRRERRSLANILSLKAGQAHRNL